MFCPRTLHLGCNFLSEYKCDKNNTDKHEILYEGKRGRFKLQPVKHLKVTGFSKYEQFYISKSALLQ